MIIIQAEYLPNPDNIGNPVKVTYDNGSFTVFNFEEGNLMYEKLQEWIADGNSVVDPNAE